MGMAKAGGIRVSDIYRLTLWSDPDGSRELPRRELANRLARIPNLEEASVGLYHFGERDEDGVMEIELLLIRDGEKIPLTEPAGDDGGSYNRIEVRVPRSWVMAKGPQVFAIVFMMAEWNRWAVYDEQIEQTLQKEAVLQGLVAMRQAKLEAEGRGGPPGTRAHFAEGKPAAGPPAAGPPPSPSPDPEDSERD
jgi:hypothetical protein